MTTTAVPAPATRVKPPRRRTFYRGDPGMWSWVLHRITGATIFFFLFVHVLDTALVRVSPQAYNEVVETYKTPIIGLMELGLVAAVLYHALNGVRVILVDFWGQGPRYQRQMLWAVAAAMPNFEKYAWLFMRFSGVVLIFLVLGHLFIGLIMENGVYRVDFNYVAQRWASPFWQIWDLSMLWLAQLHGGNGMRTIIADYARKDSTRFWLNGMLAVSMALILVVGTYVLLTFDPNIT